MVKRWPSFYSIFKRRTRETEIMGHAPWIFGRGDTFATNGSLKPWTLLRWSPSPRPASRNAPASVASVASAAAHAVGVALGQGWWRTSWIGRQLSSSLPCGCDGLVGFHLTCVCSIEPRKWFRVIISILEALSDSDSTQQQAMASTL